MPLVSDLFAGDPIFEACLVRDDAHITQGARGFHVVKIHYALLVLDNATQLATEDEGDFYGPVTAAAVRAYKVKRSIINYSYETAADNIVGKMTIARMDTDMRHYEITTAMRPIRNNPRFGGPFRHSVQVRR